MGKLTNPYIPSSGASSNDLGIFITARPRRFYDDIGYVSPPFKRKVSKAYCSSLKCVKDTNSNRNNESYLTSDMKVPKDVALDCIDCPDCSHALRWGK